MTLRGVYCKELCYMYGRDLPRRRKKITRKPVRINFTSATTKYDDPGTAAAADD